MSDFSDDVAADNTTKRPRPSYVADADCAKDEARYELRHDIPRLTVIRPSTDRRTTAPALASIEFSQLDRWGALANPLELAGGHAMRQLDSGGLALTRALSASMPWLDGVIRSIELQLLTSLAAGRPWLALRPMLLVGPPGCGKSHLALQLAALAGCGSGTLDMGGTSDNRTLEGTARGYSNRQPCWPLAVIAATRTANPVLVLEELDKAGGSERNGDAKATLLAMLEPSTARAWFDTCLMAPADLSAVNWILTANGVDRLPRPLLSRLDVHSVELPAPRHFDAVLAGLLAGIGHDLQLRPENIPELPRRARLLLRRRFISDRSVRLLARHARSMVGALLADQGGPYRQEYAGRSSGAGLRAALTVILLVSGTAAFGRRSNDRGRSLSCGAMAAIRLNFGRSEAEAGAIASPHDWQAGVVGLIPPLSNCNTVF